MHILSNERVRELARLTEVRPREIGYWEVHWTSPELSQAEADRVRHAAGRLLGAKELRPGAFAMEPEDVRATVEGILQGRTPGVSAGNGRVQDGRGPEGQGGSGWGQHGRGPDGRAERTSVQEPEAAAKSTPQPMPLWLARMEGIERERRARG